jgi:hypothetical protein
MVPLTVVAPSRPLPSTSGMSRRLTLRTAVPLRAMCSSCCRSQPGRFQQMAGQRGMWCGWQQAQALNAIEAVCTRCLDCCCLPQDPPPCLTPPLLNDTPRRAPMQGWPAMMAIVAGVAPACLTTASTSRAVCRFWG